MDCQNNYKFNESQYNKLIHTLCPSVASKYGVSKDRGTEEGVEVRTTSRSTLCPWSSKSFKATEISGEIGVWALTCETYIDSSAKASGGHTSNWYNMV